MVYIKRQELEKIIFAILKAAGVSEKHSQIVAGHLAENDALGVHSHGVILLADYVKSIQTGVIIPNEIPAIVDDALSTASVDGHWTFGQVVATYATELVIEKAKNTGISCVTMRNLTHLGRLGAYAEKIAGVGLASLLFSADGGHGHHQVPFGGKKARLGSNPIAMSFPFRDNAPFLLDFATSAVAAGKILVSNSRGQKLKEGWLLDADGNPTIDPADYLKGGALLPLGGSEGHKGYALAFMTAVFSTILSQGGIPGAPSKKWSNTSMFIAIDVQKFVPLEKTKQDGEVIVQHVKNTPLVDAAKPVLYPGELEAQAHQKANEERICLEQVTWDRILLLLKEFSIEQHFDCNIEN